MTSAEVAPQEASAQRRLGPDACHRRSSFKCGLPGRPVHQRPNRRSASVQALTTKFNLMSSQPTAGKRPNRMLIGKPKKFANPTGEVVVKPSVPKRSVFIENVKKAPLKNVTNLTRIERTLSDQTTSKELKGPEYLENEISSPERRNNDVTLNKNNFTARLEPVHESSCLPVKTAIGFFENGAVKKPAKPVAAVKPMLKTIEEKPKPKLSPKDSLSRVKYKILRRTRGQESESDEEQEKKLGSLSSMGSMIIKADEIVISDVNIEEEKVSVNERRKSLELFASTVKNDLPVKNTSSLHRKSNCAKIELRRKLSDAKFDEVQRNLSQENIIVVNKEEEERADKLQDIFNQISQSSVTARYARKEVRSSEERYEIYAQRSAIGQPNNAFREISESKVAIAKVTNKNGGRSFAGLLKNQQESKDYEESNENLYEMPDSLVSEEERIRLDVEKLYEDAEKATLRSMSPLPEGKSSQDDEKAENPRPNPSFLWSKSCEPEVKSPMGSTPLPDLPEPEMKGGMANTPLPKPPESYIPDCSYDRLDSRRSSVSEDGTEYDDISLNDVNDNTYDAIGHEAPQNKYHGIGSKDVVNESLYCVSERLDTMNVYEDIQSLRANVAEYEKGLKNEECYEEVTESGDGCYESIYRGVNGLGVGRSDSSTKSSFEKLNSLYESATGAITILGGGSESGSSQKSRGTGQDGDNLSSNDSCLSNDTTNSDDWVEESDSEPEPHFQQIHRRSKRQKRPRAKWSELQKRTNEKIEEEVAALTNEEHLYESINQSEVSAHQDSSLESSSAYHTQEDVADDSSCIDDFSSDDDFTVAELPSEPVQQYKIAQSLRDAGKRLRQNLTLRKSDFSKSLKKLRPKPKAEVYEESSSKFYCDLSAANKAGPRPSGPPPPPPAATDGTNGSGVQYADVRVNGTELYAECGLFKQKPKTNGGSRSSWYAESGLYGINKGPTPTEEKKPLFTDEPLYQFYTECVNAQARDDILQHYDSDGYEAINDYYTFINEKRRTLDVKVPMPNLEDFNDTPKEVPSFDALNRTLWCQVPEVVNTCILATLTEKQRKLQEAKFEILTSEGSYIHSLTVLETHFMPKLKDVISTREYRMLFSNILAVKEVSLGLLRDLEKCWHESIMLTSICDALLEHSKQHFSVYIKFCKHSTTVCRTLKTLISENPGFAAALKKCEGLPQSQSLSLSSFLMLPMQRITRYPLLLGQVLTRLEKDDPEFKVCDAAFQQINKIVRECDEEASRMEKTEEMLLLGQQLRFPKAVRPLPILSSNRCLVKRGTATLLLGKEDSKLTFGRRVSKSCVHLLLFTDLLVVAHPVKTGLRVTDYCPRNLIQIQPAPPISYLPPASQKHLVMLTLLENHENKTAEMLLSLPLESDMARWQEAVSPVLTDNPLESVYESWDCPQVIAIYEYTAPQPDELSLCIGDVVNVLKKIQDGWYQGERLRDGAVGWFPSNHTQEISSAHVRAKNKKQRYRLLASLSSPYIQPNQPNLPS